LVSDDGRSILFVVPSFKSGSAELRIWGDSLHAPKVVLPLRQQPSAISATGDFRFVAVAYGNATAELIDLETGTREPILENGSEVSALDFSGDGNLLAAGGRDGSIVLWKVSSRMKVRSFQL